MRKLLMSLLTATIAVGVLLAYAGDKQEISQTLVALKGRNLAIATFAGGCFWCVEAGFEKVPGVVEAVSGYTGGQMKDPTYKQVSSGSTGHLESVEVFYDPKRISYKGLLAAFWRQIDPTDAGGQFVDRGGQYTTAIFYKDDQQKRAAEESRDALQDSGRFDKPIATAIDPSAASILRRITTRTTTRRIRSVTASTATVPGVISIWRRPGDRTCTRTTVNTRRLALIHTISPRTRYCACG